jgi:hypothetical protein
MDDAGGIVNVPATSHYDRDRTTKTDCCRDATRQRPCIILPNVCFSQQPPFPDASKSGRNVPISVIRTSLSAT